MKAIIIAPLFILFLFLEANIAFSQKNEYFTGLQAELKPSSANIGSELNVKNDDSINWMEDKNERTLYSSTYKSEDGQIKIIYSKRPINYFDSNKKLIPINAELKCINSNSWTSIEQPFPTYLKSDGSFSVTLDNNKQLSLGKNCKINGVKTATSFEFNGNQNTIYNVIPGVDKQLIFYENAIKYNYVIIEHLVIEDNSLSISEEVNLPKGYTLQTNSNNGSQTTDGWAGDLIITNSNGEVVGTIYAPICYDATKNYIIGSYKIKNENDALVLEMIVPANWLNASERVYPIVIDPIVTGPTTTWAGGTMPSCILPAYNVDSIQVTIPAGVTITTMNVTASFYADPFTSAVMSQGSMFFSTTCANSQTFTITGPNANLAGTGYLDNFNLFSPLTCCFPESCNSTNFYLRMHLGRTGPGTGCNTTYIRYDPTTTSWPFKATIIGKTAETYGGKWVVSQIPICSNTCTITGNAYSYFGVAPYTYTHPWSTEIVTQGTNSGCGTGANYFHFTMTIPNCPDYCDENFTSLSVPPPTIIDACGNSVTGIPPVIIPIKTAPQVSIIYDSIVCSGDPFVIGLTPCVPTSTVNWSGNGTSGNSDISETFTNNGSNVTTTNYSVSATSNGCFSDTTNITVYTEPLPNANYSNNPELAIINTAIDFTDISSVSVGNIVSWFWTFGDNSTSLDQNNTHIYTELGTYTVCLEVTTTNGCTDAFCKEILVAPAEISIPNIVTANGDGINDLLEFQYLDFFPDNDLKILNRWGSLIYEKHGYTNDWNGATYTEGTYFFILTVNGEEKKYSGFFQLVK